MQLLDGGRPWPFLFSEKESGMEVKVALASSDGTQVDQHFGRASRFSIYRLRDGQWEHLEDRVNQPACAGHEHADGILEQSAALIADCRGVAVSQIGVTAMDVLLARRILPFVLAGPVSDALATLQKSKLINRPTFTKEAADVEDCQQRD
jgi:nitrogen fixation protein NifX